MRCRETKYWLYSLRPNTSWPVDVVTHLQTCVKCQQVQSRLKQIDIEVNKLTTVTSNAPGKAKLLEQIERTPQTATLATPRSAWPFVRFAGILTSAAALIVLGFFLGRGGVSESQNVEPLEREKIVEIIKERPVEIFRDKIVKVESQTERNLFAALLQRNVRLVQSGQVKGRLEALLDMADDCRKHALALIDQGPRDSLPLTIDLYTQLLRVGVPAELQQAPADIRPVLSATTRIRLSKMAEPGEEAKTLPKLLAEQRDLLQSIAKEAMELPATPAVVVAAKDQRPLTPSAAVVQFALGYASQKGAVAKADACADCVNRLLPYMMLCLTDGSGPQAGDLGQRFGEFIQSGIYGPLATLSTQEPDPAVKEEMGRIYQNVAQTIAEMEKTMQAAPKSAQGNFERALEATRKRTPPLLNPK